MTNQDVVNLKLRCVWLLKVKWTSLRRNDDIDLLTAAKYHIITL